ncbi:MAG: cation transporter [Candidatus Nanohalobium sp.]
MEKTELEVRGMSCRGCEKTVENALSQVEDVLDVEASHKDGKVEVKTRSRTKEALEEATHEAGFEVKA